MEELCTINVAVLEVELKALLILLLEGDLSIDGVAIDLLLADDVPRDGLEEELNVDVLLIEEILMVGEELYFLVDQVPVVEGPEQHVVVFDQNSEVLENVLVGLVVGVFPHRVNQVGLEGLPEHVPVVLVDFVVGAEREGVQVVGRDGGEKKEQGQKREHL